MKATEFCKWWVVDKLTGKRRMTNYKMTRKTALERHPNAEPVKYFPGIRSPDWLKI